MTATILNVRASTTTHSKIVGKITRNTAVTLYQKKGSWGKVKANGKIGWVSTAYLTAKKPVTARTLYVTADTPLKSSATSQAKTVRTLKKGTAVTIYTTTYGSYYKAKQSNHSGWVLKSKVTSIKKVRTTKTESINYNTMKQTDSSLEKNKTKVVRSGKKGSKVTTYETTYQNGKAISTKVVSTKIIRKPINQIVKVGTKVNTIPNQVVASSAISQLFKISASIQSITFFKNYYYIVTDTPDNSSVIYKYDSSGQLVGNTGVLPIVHGASISVNESNGHLFVTNGGATNPTKVYEVDFDTKKILSVIDLSRLGHSGLSVVDQSTGYLWVETAPNDYGPQTFSYCDLKGNVLKQFTLPNQGVPQGIDYKNGLIYLYTNHKITVIAPDGHILRSLTVNLPGESEGMAILPDGRMVVGFSVWQPTAKRHEGDFYFIKGFQ